MRFSETTKTKDTQENRQKYFLERITEICDLYPQVPAVYERLPGKDHEPGLSLTYGELDELSSIIGANLYMKGVRANDTVAMSLDRSAVGVAIMLGIMKAGAVYLPICTDYPLSLVRDIISECDVKHLICDTINRKDLPSCIIMNSNDVLTDHGKRTDRHFSYPDICYIIYTSGSSGKPKGVAINQTNLASLLESIKEEILSVKGKIASLFASFCFDASIWEISLAFLNAKTLYVFNQDEVYHINTFIESANREKIALMTLPPSYLQKLDCRRLPYIELLISAGERLNADLYNRWIAHTRVVNAYGPTECTVCVSLFCSGVPCETEVPIGRTLRNCRVYILDEDMNEVESGVVGEIYVTGDGVSPGYINSLYNQDSFIYHLELSDTALYRTRDRGWLDDVGCLHYSGRSDRQVKFNGFRIELDQIEICIQSHPQVLDAAVVVCDGNIYAFLTTELSDLIDIKKYCLAHLPDYMFPCSFIRLKSIPYRQNEKKDYTLLADMLAQENEWNTLRRQLTSAYSSVLKKDNILPNDNFFEIGGQSMYAVDVVRVLSDMGIKIKITDIYIYPTIDEMCDFILNTQNAQRGACDE